jgi:hypothetical protein
MFSGGHAITKATRSARSIARGCKRGVPLDVAIKVPEIGRNGVNANFGPLYEMVGIEAVLSDMDN